MHEESIPFTKLTNNEFDTFNKLGINSLLDIENTVFTPSPSQQIMLDNLTNLITQHSYCNDTEQYNDEEVKLTNC